MITSILGVAGGNTSHGQVDSAWVVLWSQAEAAVAVIVVCVTAFRALFVAHKASKHQSPPQQNDNLTSRSMLRKRINKGGSGPGTPEPPFTGVRTDVRRGPYDASFNDGSQEIEMPVQRPGIIVTHNISSEEVVCPVL